MDINAKLSCDDFLLVNSSSSIQTGLDYPCAKLCVTCEDPQAKSKSLTSSQDSVNKCPPMLGTSSTLSSMSSGFLQQDCRLPKQPLPEPPNIGYELALAKSIMQQYSTISGDNLFDHLSDIIKRVIDERPPNVIDFFEEFSRSVREQKFHLPERFPPDAIFEETSMYKVAKNLLSSMNLPYTEDLTFPDEDIEEEDNTKLYDSKLELEQKSLAILGTFNERIQHLQFFWNQCGFSISSDDIFQLACSMDRLQNHPSIRQCRFWGIINGLKASYYIVEASLTNEECESRLLQMEQEIKETEIDEKIKESKLPSHIGPELTPGAIGWENYPDDELMKMKPNTLPVPLTKVEEIFDVPPEPIGVGLNRYVYFVVTSLSDDWIELPIVTPKQLNVSRQIKKFLSGDLESDIISYPFFPGKEKHYLRAMISRITAGTYIAPNNYYRKMTKKEKRLFEGFGDNEVSDEEEDEEDSQVGEDEDQDEDEQDNDIVLLKNEKYDFASPLNTLNNLSKWVHVRPNILKQGRVVWYDEEKARRDKEKDLKRLEKLQISQENDQEEDEEAESDDDEEVEDEDEDEVFAIRAEVGPFILSPCSRDKNEETPVPWVGRFTSKFTNKNERILMMQSNIWPGAYTFIYENLCDNIYLGWGHKYVSRNMNWQHLSAIAEEFLHEPKDFLEAIDPSVEMEEAYRLSLLKRELKMAVKGEHLSDFENDTNESSDEDEAEEEDDEEEEEE